jgi:hypothetical protein
MKKFAKMSLVAAVAVAGMTSYSSAASLEEAIKDTTISGYLRYRIETDHETDNTDTSTRAKYVVKTTTKVNDNVTATTKLVGETYNSDTGVDVDQLFFTYANAGATVSVGRQGLVSPLTDNGNDGDGIVATYGMGPVTFAGAYYWSLGNTGYEKGSTVAINNNLQNANTNNLQNANTTVNHYGIGVLGSVEMVNFAGWYLWTDDEVVGVNAFGNGADAFALSADATVGPVSGYAFYSELDVDALDQDWSFLKTGLSTSFGIVSASLDFVKTGEDSGNTTLDNDVDAEANLGLLTNDMMLINDATAWHLGLSAKVTDSITLGAHYLSVDGDDNSNVEDATETELNAKYQMSKNFYVLGRLSMGEVDDGNALTEDDFSNSRIELKYSF